MAVRPDPRFEPCEWSYGYEKRLLQLMKLLADHWPIVIDSMTCLFSLIRVLPNFVWSGGSIRRGVGARIGKYAGSGVT